MKSIKYNRGKCIACGICSTRAAHSWIVSPTDGKADLVDSIWKKEHYFSVLWQDEIDLMLEIVTLCPTRAIQLV